MPNTRTLLSWENGKASTHRLTVFNAVDLPDDVARQVMALLAPYDADIYTRDCDEEGRAI